MRRAFLLCVPLFLLLAPKSPAQEILPANVAGWNASAGSANEDLQQIAGPAVAALKEYGVQSAESRIYAHGQASLTATVYRFKNTAGAYGAYSFLRAPDMLPAKLTQHSSLSQNRALALTGNLVLEFTGRNLREDSDPVELLVAEAGGHAQWGSYPALPQRLPKDGFIPRSDRYVWGPVALSQFLPLVSGDWLGFSKGAAAELARYKLEGKNSTLVIVDYPTPQLAADELKQLETQFGAVTPDRAGAHSGTNSAIPNSVHLYARRDSTVIALIPDAPSERAANSLLEQVHSGLLLTWNEPVQEKRQPSMVTIVIGTFVGAGEICAFTLLGGVLFAGFRLLVKHWWPGRVFDRALDLEIIELGLTGRRVKGNDLY